MPTHDKSGEALALCRSWLEEDEGRSLESVVNIDNKSREQLGKPGFNERYVAMCKAIIEAQSTPSAVADTEPLNALAEKWARYGNDGSGRHPWAAETLFRCASELKAALHTAHSASADSKDAARYRWLKDAAGREWKALLGAQMTGQLDKVIDAEMAATDRRTA